MEVIPDLHQLETATLPAHQDVPLMIPPLDAIQFLKLHQDIDVAVATITPSVVRRSLRLNKGVPPYRLHNLMIGYTLLAHIPSRYCTLTPWAHRSTPYPS